MNLEDLRKSVWGYKRESVLQYIASREKELSQKLAQRDDQAEQELQQAKDRIQELERDSMEAYTKYHRLEQKARELRNEADTLRQRQARISDTLMEARTYAQNLRKESQAKGYQAQEQLRTVLSANLNQLTDYLEKVQSLRRAFQELLQELEPVQTTPPPTEPQDSPEAEETDLCEELPVSSDDIQESQQSETETEPEEEETQEEEPHGQNVTLLRFETGKAGVV